MIKKLALLICCILLVPTIAAASDGSTNYGDFWVGGQVDGSIYCRPKSERDGSFWF